MKIMKIISGLIQLCTTRLSFAAPYNNSKTPIYPSVEQSGFLNQGEFNFFTIESCETVDQLTVYLYGLRNDLDLYVKENSWVNTKDYDYGSENGGNAVEECVLSISPNSKIDISVYGYQSGSSKL